MKRKAPASSPGGEDVKVETFVHYDFAGRYDGEADDEGRPHGVGILRLDDDGAWYQGEFRHGAKHGQGTLHFPPDDSDDDEDEDDDNEMVPRRRWRACRREGIASEGPSPTIASRATQSTSPAETVPAARGSGTTASSPG